MSQPSALAVLLIDPDPTLREEVTEHLKGRSSTTTVTTASTPSDARTRLDREDFDCVVSECDLPGTEGLDHLEEIRSKHPTLPIILYTDRPAEGLIERAFQIGVTDYLPKQDGTEYYEVLERRIRAAVRAARRDGTAVPTDAQRALEFVSNAPVGFLTFDASGKIAFASERAASLLGRSSSELTSLDYNASTFDFVDTQDNPVSDDDHPVRRVLRSESPVTDVELGVLTPEEERIWLSVHVAPLYEEETMSGAIATFQDITGRIRAETKLDEVLERMTDSFIAFDTDWRYTYLNEAAAIINQRPVEEHIGQVVWDMYPESTVFWDQYHEAMETQEPTSFEAYVPDPINRWAEARLYPDESGLTLYIQDVTERKDRERVLERYETIVQTATEGICVLDQDWTFTMVNDALVRLTGYSRDELLGSPASLVGMDEDAAVPTSLRDEPSPGTERVVKVEGEIATKSGSRSPVETWFAPIQFEEQVHGTVGVVRDVSERKRSERAFTTLYELAHDLLSATTEEEVAQTSVNAATELLALSDVVLFRFNDTENTFVPIAFSEEPRSRGWRQRPISATEENPITRSFFDAEVLTLDDNPDSNGFLDLGAQIHSGLAVPLGEHGVLLAGDTTDVEFDRQTRTIAELLGTTVRSAIDRLVREQVLRERQWELQARTVQLERLNQINELIRGIDERLVSAKSREEIERTVCEQLVARDQYALAWIGERDTDMETITVRARAGAERGYLDGLSDIAREEATPSEPFYRTAESGERSVETNIVDGLRTERWRREALSRGFQSVLSVPLQFEEIPYGVLTVYGTTTNTFDPLIRTVFDELSETIAHAINNVETKRGLVADDVIELHLRLRTSRDVLHLVAGCAGCSLTYEAVLPQAEDRYLLFFTGPASSVEAVEATAEQLTSVDRIRVLSTGDGVGVFEAAVVEQPLALRLVEHGAVPKEITTDGDTLEATVEVPLSKDIRELLELLRTHYPDLELVGRRPRGRQRQTRELFQTKLATQLTERQFQALVAAYHSGYFESPRRRTGDEIANTLGISQPTFHYHLRRGLRTVLDQLLTTTGGARPLEA